jgi:succinylglutamate desuccinylase
MTVDDMDVERIIGSYTEGRKGPLLVCLAGIHGNEHAGIEALRFLFTLIEQEPQLNSQFEFYGRMVGIAGNLKALRKKQRYLQHDLNRLWTQDRIQRIRQTPRHQLQNEEEEIYDILSVIRQEIREHQPSKLVILDLHTTTATGGIFTITADDPESVAIGTELHAPVIKGLIRSIQGTTLQYFNSLNLGLPTVAVTFESGQHNDPLSVNRAMAATINCMRTIGCVKAEHVENRHDALLIEYSRGLPKIADLIMRHRIEEGDGFVMEPGYKNFQRVKKGELLAKDKNGPIYAQEDGSILMPLYQKQGDDGFFLIRTVEKFELA